MAQATSSADPRSQVFFMLVSAAIFTYFGFGSDWSHQYTTDQPPRLIYMIALLKWTLWIGAAVFAVTSLLALAGSWIGPLLYSAAGLATAAVFIVVAAWVWLNPAGYVTVAPPILLVIFGLWNGYGSIVELREWAIVRRRTRAEG